MKKPSFQSRLGQHQRQGARRTASADAATDALVDLLGMEEEDWQEYDSPDHLKRGSDRPFQLLKPWDWMLKHGVMSEDGKPRKLEQITLEPNNFVSAEELEKKHKYKYFPEEDKIKTEITSDTLFWYPKGKYNLLDPDPDSPNHRPNPKSPDREIAGILLKGVLSKEAQQQALEGLQQMEPWPLPTRPETKTAIERQQGSNTPGEHTMGYNGYMTIERTKAVREHKDAFAHLGPLIYEMNDCYSRVLPFYYKKQNVPKSLTGRFAERVKFQQKSSYDYGGILEDLRQLATTAFSTLALLKSCPSSIHQDAGNARQEQTSFTCLTSIRPPEGFTGGTFCFIEYGIKVPVQPGDILIAQTTREWHCNVGQVKGVKYSLVCYYKRGLANPILERKKSTFDNPTSSPKSPRRRTNISPKPESTKGGRGFGAKQHSRMTILT